MRGQHRSANAGGGFGNTLVRQGLLLPEPERRRRAVRLRSGEASAGEATELALGRIDAVDDSVRAFLHIDREGARARARSLDRQPRHRRGPLFGLPVAVKDNIAVRSWLSTSGSALLRGYRAPYDATVVERLRGAGAVLLGTTNLDEFGMGSATTRGFHGPSRNPADPQRVAGGSSGGSAAAVAAGTAHAALGTDTGGSVRQPAAHCGVFGIRPTYGRVSRYGVTAYASSFDQVGCLASDLTDLGRVLGAVAGLDPRDATSAARDVPDFAAAAGRPALPRTIAACGENDLAVLDPASQEAFAAVIRRFEQRGVIVRRVELPDTETAVAAYYLLACAEASSNLARFDGMRYGQPEAGGLRLEAAFRETRTRGLGREVRRRILAGATVLSRGYRDSIYRASTEIRKRIARELLGLFGERELLLLPITCGPPRLLDEPPPRAQEYRSDRFTILASLAALPAISLPAGESRGLPFGVELMAPPWGEEALFSAAAAFVEAA